LLCMGVIRDHVRAILGGLLFLYDVKVPFGSWFVGHTWSLAVEEQFYLIFPALFVLTRELWRTRVFVGIFCLLVVWRISMVYTGDAGLVYGETRTGFACIACGVLMAIHEKRVRRIAAAFPGFIVALLAVILLVHPVTDMSWESALYESLLVPPSVGLILAFSLECGPRLRTFLCCKPAQALGVTSYGIYLWQELFTAPGEYLLGWGELIPKLFPLLAVVVPVSYFLIEKPAMRYGKTISQRVRDESVPRIAVS
jgi:peptidoglycan/LPS O-acetylase OafA/YrhL